MAEMTDLLVSFGVYGDAPGPDEITQMLGLEPSRSAAKGHTQQTRTGTIITTKKSVWLLDSRLAASARLEDHLRDLLGRLLPHAAEIRDLRRQGLEVEFRCAVFTVAPEEGTTVNAETVRGLGELEAALSIVVYPLGQS